MPKAFLYSFRLQRMPKASARWRYAATACRAVRGRSLSITRLWLRSKRRAYRSSCRQTSQSISRGRQVCLTWITALSQQDLSAYTAATCLFRLAILVFNKQRLRGPRVHFPNVKKLPNDSFFPKRQCLWITVLGANFGEIFTLVKRSPGN